MSKIFIRHRRHVGQGAGRPRFAVIAVHGSDIRFKRSFVRRAELEKIAQEADAEIVYLPSGDKAGGEGQPGRGQGRRRKRKQSAN